MGCWHNIFVFPDYEIDNYTQIQKQVSLQVKYNPKGPYYMALVNMERLDMIFFPC